MLKLLLVFFLLCCRTSFAQYILNGSAQKNSCNCYTLTTASQTQSGSVWNSNKINLTSSFDFAFKIFLGCSDAGADGIVFMLQPISTSVGTTGEGMGFSGVSPSIGIALDTYQNLNLNDPDYDHISIQANGVVNHTNDLAGPVPISPVNNNVEDCNWHSLRITWDAPTKWLRTYFDGALRVEKQIDLVSTIFNNDPSVYWGFSGATGGQVNLQQFCTALDPIFTINTPDNATCAGRQVNFTNTSQSFAPIVSYNWLFGDGDTSTAINPSHTYRQPGHYPVNLKIKGLDGCENDSTIQITAGDIPAVTLAATDACYNTAPQLTTTADSLGINFYWRTDGGAFGSQQPLLDTLPVGDHTLDLLAISVSNCGVPDTASATFTIKPLPQVAAGFQDGCADVNLAFSGNQSDAATSITQWNWRFGDGGKATQQTTLHQYNDSGRFDVQLWAIAGNGCTSDTVEKSITINKAFVAAGRDTVAIRNLPFQLHGSGHGALFWSPGAGLSSDTIASPTVRLAANQQFVLMVRTQEGCTAADTVSINVYDGPTVYVPSAFTPNGDGKNDVLLPVYVGMKELKDFSIFNRWGQNVFTTKDRYKGWDGRGFSGTLVWVISAVNYLNQPVVFKGTVTIIR